LTYYPEATGTYWPLEIEFLLEPGELRTTRGKVRGLKNSGNQEIGKIVKDHPLQSRAFSYEHILKLIRKLRLEFPMRYILQRELAIEANPRRLRFFNSWTKSISGGFTPIYSLETFAEMNRRFDSAGKKSPFRKEIGTEKYICIHYRIGDKRTNFRTNFNDHDGIIDPKNFANILGMIDDANELSTYVISDEPIVASRMLREVGIQAEVFPGDSDIWRDVYLASQAQIFIGSWSQVSQLAALCVSGNGGKSFLPLSSQNGRVAKWKIAQNEWFIPIILEPSHWIYQAP